VVDLSSSGKMQLESKRGLNNSKGVILKIKGCKLINDKLT
jgi:hypothetical protein